MSERLYKSLKLISLCLFFCVCFIAASTIDISNAPDEAMRYPIAQFIFKNGCLPNGMEDSLVNQIWGFSYALYPYLTSIISAFFMKITSFFANSPESILAAARLTSVFAGTGTLYMCFKIGEQIFKEKHFALLFSILTCFLPQFVFLSSYQNNDSFAVFCGALIVYNWIRGIKTDWNLKSCVGLAIGCGLCALSYYNAYVYILGSLILFFVHRISRRDAAEKIVRDTLIILVIAFAIGGWFFIRNYTLHGDILGMNVTSVSAEAFAMDGYKPSQLQTPQKLGMSLVETFLKSNDYQQTAWLPTVAGSFIGAFAHLTVKLPMFLYALYFMILLLGFVSFATRAIGKKIAMSFDLLLLLTLIVMIIINLGLFMYSAYTKDYQAQGRYLMPSLVPIMLFITEGYRTITDRLSRLMSDPDMSNTRRVQLFNKRGLAICLTIIIVYMVFFFISYLGFMLPGCK